MTRIIPTTADIPSTCQEPGCDGRAVAVCDEVVVQNLVTWPCNRRLCEEHRAMFGGNRDLCSRHAVEAGE